MSPAVGTTVEDVLATEGSELTRVACEVGSVVATIAEGTGGTGSLEAVFADGAGLISGSYFLYNMPCIVSTASYCSPCCHSLRRMLGVRLRRVPG